MSGALHVAAGKLQGRMGGLVTQATQRIGRLVLRHEPRRFGRSNYGLRKLVRLWIDIVFNFSILPLRAAIALGLVTALAGLTLLLAAVVEHPTRETPVGWRSLIAAITRLRRRR